MRNFSPDLAFPPPSFPLTPLPPDMILFVAFRRGTLRQAVKECFDGALRSLSHPPRIFLPFLFFNPPPSVHETMPVPTQVPFPLAMSLASLSGILILDGIPFPPSTRLTSVPSSPGSALLH